jgi:6-phospho-beta-glucosidase
MPTRTIKLTVLGGSAIGTPELIDALRKYAAQPGAVAIQVWLHGRTPDKLGPVARVASIMARDCDWLTVNASTDLAEALSGADYVINQVRIGGLEARAFDEKFPHEFGLPGDETVGPGGFANALRTIPAVLKLMEAVVHYAPLALLLSFSNPASVVQYAVSRATPLTMIGLCDVPVTMQHQVAAALEVPAADLSVEYVGMHHFGFITRVVHDGNDLTERLLARLDRIPALEMDIDWVRALGAFPTRYLRYFLTPERFHLAQTRETQSRAGELMRLEKDLLVEYATTQTRPAGLSKRGAKWYDAVIGPVLMAIIERRTATHIVNVENRQTLPFLPAEAIIEAPCLLAAGQVTPLAMASLSTLSHELRARLHLNCAYEQLLVDAILEQSEGKALRALALNPMIPSLSVARSILSRVWPDGVAKA